MALTRRGWIVGIGVFAFVALVAANILAFPRYFGAAVSFEWQATTGFSTIYLFPPSAKVGPLARILGGMIALEARPFIAAELRKYGWKKAKGCFVVQSVPFPPIVTGLGRSSHWTLIDPEVTPLMEAAEQGGFEVVKRLLASGADVNARDQRGWTPLIHACKSSKTNGQTVEELIANGAEVNAKDGAGRTALIWASGIGAVDKVHMLLAAHADPNARSQFGETPLWNAVNAPSIATAEELLAAQADPNAVAVEGRSLLSVALGAGDTEMADLLTRAGARK